MAHELIAEPIDDMSQVFLPEPEVKLEPIDPDYLPDDEDAFKQDWPTVAVQPNFPYITPQTTMGGGKRYSTTSALLVKHSIDIFRRFQ